MASVLYENGVQMVGRVCTGFAVTQEDTTSVSIQIELRDNAGNLVAGNTRAAVRNMTYEF